MGIPARFAVAQRSTAECLGLFAAAKRLFERRGVDFQLVAFETAAERGVEGLTAGEWDYIEIGVIPLVRLRADGHDPACGRHNADEYQFSHGPPRYYARGRTGWWSGWVPVVGWSDSRSGTRGAWSEWHRGYGRTCALGKVLEDFRRYWRRRHRWRNPSGRFPISWRGTSRHAHTCRYWQRDRDAGYLCRHDAAGGCT